MRVSRSEARRPRKEDREKIVAKKCNDSSDLRFSVDFVWTLGPRSGKVLAMDATNTPRSHATPACFAAWEARAKSYSVAQLRYAVKDCFQAADAADSMGKHIVAGRYLDEAATYMRELRTR